MEPQSSVSLLQLGGLMVGLIVVAVIFIVAALLITRQRNESTRKARADAPAQPAKKRRKQTASGRPSRKPQTSRQPSSTKRPAQQKRRKPASQPTIETPPAPDEAVPAPYGATELMRVYRDPAGGDLIIQIDGENYRTLGDIKQAGIEKPFMAVLRDLARTAKETGNQLSSEATERPPQTTQPAPDPTPDRPPLTAVPPTLEELTGETSQPQEVEPMGTFFGNVRKMIPGSPSDVEMAAPLGIADQIEAVLQLKLLTSETFKGQRLHIKPAPSGGVQIEVGDKIYEAVSDIEDDGIREFVQSAIQDWERQQG